MKRVDSLPSKPCRARATGALLLLAGWMMVQGCSSPPPEASPPLALQQANHYQSSASRFSERQQWTAAAREWDVAARHYALLNQRAPQAVALHNLALAHRHLRQFQQAIAAVHEAARLNLALEQSTEWWRNQVLLLQLEAATGPAEVLDRHFQDLLPRWESELQDTVTRASFLNEYGLRQWKKGELQPAMNTFKDAQSLFEKAGHRNGQATALANLARVQEAQASPEPAHQTWRNALVVFEETGHLPGIATALAGLGRTLLQSPHDRDLARDYLERAAANFQQLHMEAEHQETSRLLQQLADGE